MKKIQDALAFDQGDINVIPRADMIKIEPNQSYRLIITWESENGRTKITPTITIPSKKGWIKSRNYDTSFMLSTCNSKVHPVCEVDVFSESGYIEISYHCSVTDYRKVSYWASSKILQQTGIKKEVLSLTKNRYLCADEFGDFGGYVFSVEWKRKTGTATLS